MVNNVGSRAQQPAASDVRVYVCMSLDVGACGGSGLGLLVFLDNSPPYILFTCFFFLHVDVCVVDIMCTYILVCMALV